MCILLSPQLYLSPQLSMSIFRIHFQLSFIFVLKIAVYLFSSSYICSSFFLLRYLFIFVPLQISVYLCSGQNIPRFLYILSSFFQGFALNDILFANYIRMRPSPIIDFSRAVKKTLKSIINISTFYKQIDRSVFYYFNVYFKILFLI